MDFTIRKCDDGSDAAELLKSLRAAYPQTGDYPFFIGKEEELERIMAIAEEREETSDEIIRESQNIDVGEWIIRWRSIREEQYKDFGFDLQPELGDWPDDDEFEEDDWKVEASRDPWRDLGRSEGEVLVGLARIKEPWHLPASLRYGAWNECPPPEVHCAFFRAWQSEYGAEIIKASGDIIECLVSNPPRDQAAAVKLAWEQYWYCSDIVEQGSESIHGLAAGLLDSPRWYFWWD